MSLPIQFIVTLTKEDLLKAIVRRTNLVYFLMGGILIKYILESYIVILVFLKRGFHQNVCNDGRVLFVIVLVEK